MTRLSKFSHKIRSETLQTYAGDFELNESMVMGPVEQKTKLRFRKMDDFESYINAIDVAYDGEDFIFTGYVYKVNSSQFSVVNRCFHANGVN